MIALHDHIRVHVRGEWVAVEVTRLPVVCAMCDDTHTMTLHRANGDIEQVMCTSCPVPCSRCRAGGNGPYCATPRCDCDCHRGALLMRGTWSGRSDDGRLVTWDASHEVEACETVWRDESGNGNDMRGAWLAVPMHDLTVACAFGWGSLGPEECQRAALEGALAGWRMRALLSEAEAVRLGKLFDDAGEGTYDVLALVDHYQRCVLDAEQERDDARAEVRRLRDRLAIAEHQHELARDVLRASDGQLTDPERPGHRAASALTFSDAVDRWRAAGRPGLGGER